MINVYRASDELFEKSKIGNNREKAEKNMRKWCKENFINSRSVRQARDIHRQATSSFLGLKLKYVWFPVCFNFKVISLTFDFSGMHSPIA